jgi:hypothetical protein
MRQVRWTVGRWRERGVSWRTRGSSPDGLVDHANEWLEAGRFIGAWRGLVHREMDYPGLKLLLEGGEVKRRHKRYQVMRENA